MSFVSNREHDLATLVVSITQHTKNYNLLWISVAVTRCSGNNFVYLPPANEVCGKVIFLHVCVILCTEGGPAWLPGGGVAGDMCGEG